MHARVWMVAIAALAVAGSTGCGKDASSSASDFQKQRENIVARQRQAPPSQATPEAAAGASSPGEEAAMEPVAYRYDPLGKRDPFRSFVLDRIKDEDTTTKGPLERFELQQLNVLGVVWETNNRRALVADPSGRAYIVSEGDAIGKNDGRIVSIDDNLLLVKETYEDYVGERTTKEIELRVRQAQGG